jgi:peptidoglycan/xylan/chitin deacetylase (PgdA/CDA1 family)
MKAAALKLFYRLLKLTGGRPFTSRYSGKVQILMFHRIVAQHGEGRIDNDGIELTEHYLDYLIGFYLQKGFTPIAINDLQRVLTDKSSRRYVAFTFDDGYYDNLEKALPIFERHRVPFAVYIPTDFITRKQFAWWYFIEDVIRDHTSITYLYKGEEKTAGIERKDQKDAFFMALRTMIQEDAATLAALMERYRPDMNAYHNLFLNAEQLAQLAAHPLVTIGSHSVTHPSLAKLSDEASYKEIIDSKKELESLIGKAVNHFSYPFGTVNDVSERELKHAKDAGYLTALTTVYGDVHANSDLYHLPRIWTSEHNQETELLKSIFGINAYRLRKQK